MNKKTVRDVDVKGKRVLVRCDFNVPMKDGTITDENRIIGALPTIKYLLEQGAMVTLCSHMGKPHSIFSAEVKLNKKDKKKVEAGETTEKTHARTRSRSAQRTARRQSGFRFRRDRTRRESEARRLQTRRSGASRKSPLPLGGGRQGRSVLQGSCV